MVRIPGVYSNKSLVERASIFEVADNEQIEVCRRLQFEDRYRVLKLQKIGKPHCILRLEVAVFFNQNLCYSVVVGQKLYGRAKVIITTNHGTLTPVSMLLYILDQQHF